MRANSKDFQALPLEKQRCLKEFLYGDDCPASAEACSSPELLLEAEKWIRAHGDAAPSAFAEVEFGEQVARVWGLIQDKERQVIELEKMEADTNPHLQTTRAAAEQFRSKLRRESSANPAQSEKCLTRLKHVDVWEAKKIEELQNALVELREKSSKTQANITEALKSLVKLALEEYMKCRPEADREVMTLTQDLENFLSLADHENPPAHAAGQDPSLEASTTGVPPAAATVKDVPPADAAGQYPNLEASTKGVPPADATLKGVPPADATLKGQDPNLESSMNGVPPADATPTSVPPVDAAGQDPDLETSTKGAPPADATGVPSPHAAGQDPNVEASTKNVPPADAASQNPDPEASICSRKNKHHSYNSEKATPGRFYNQSSYSNLPPCPGEAGL